MHQRLVGSTGLSVSEIGFGVWTIATGWWGKYTEEEAVVLLTRYLEAVPGDQRAITALHSVTGNGEAKFDPIESVSASETSGDTND